MPSLALPDYVEEEDPDGVPPWTEELCVHPLFSLQRESSAHHSLLLSDVTNACAISHGSCYEIASSSARPRGGRTKRDGGRRHSSRRGRVGRATSERGARRGRQGRSDESRRDRVQQDLRRGREIELDEVPLMNRRAPRPSSCPRLKSCVLSSPSDRLDMFQPRGELGVELLRLCEHNPCEKRTTNQ